MTVDDLNWILTGCVVALWLLGMMIFLFSGRRKK
jgi:hypothetical protein